MVDTAARWADAVNDVVVALDSFFASIPGEDWQRPAAHVGWSCWRTAEHISGDFAHYASQVVARPTDHYVAFKFDTSRAESVPQLREVVRAAGGMLAASVRVADPDGLGWHPHGMFSPTGFAAIGAAEGLVHGHDIATGLGLTWAPPDNVTGLVLNTVFPDAGSECQGPALTGLLSATGRGTEAVGRWTYAGAAAHPRADSPPGGRRPRD